MESGEARQLTDIPKGAGAPVWSPDGKRIAFESTTLPADFEKKEHPEEKSDVRIINRAEYRDNGAGYRDFDRPAHIWTVDAPAVTEAPRKAKQITNGRFGESDIAWSRDGARIYFTSVRDLEPYYTPPYTDLFVTPSTGGEITKVAHMDGEIGPFSLDPRGERIAFAGLYNGRPQRSYSQTIFW